MIDSLQYIDPCIQTTDNGNQMQMQEYIDSNDSAAHRDNSVWLTAKSHSAMLRLQNDT